LADKPPLGWWVEMDRTVRVMLPTAPRTALRRVALLALSQTVATLTWCYQVSSGDTNSRAQALIALTNQLYLYTYAALVIITLGSPASFVADLNPLETLRKFMNDRAERRRQKAREPLDLEHLALENKILATEVTRRQLENIYLARPLGIPDEAVAPVGHIDPYVRPDPTGRELPTADNNPPPPAP
jgi:hypothetical protein